MTLFQEFQELVVASDRVVKLIFLSLLLNTSRCNSQCISDDDCPLGSWCSSHSTESNFCKSYAMEGSSCNAFTLPEDFQRCNPETHYCYEPESCIVPDVGGTCQSKASHRSNLGDCCSSNEDCVSNMCSEGETYIGTTQQLCVEEYVDGENAVINESGKVLCSEDIDCPLGSWCSSHSTESNFCKAYAMEGASCNAFTLPEDFQICNPETHYCYEPESCVIADAGGTCQSKASHRSNLGDCCSSNEDCESNMCLEGETYIGTTQKVCVEEDVEGENTINVSGKVQCAEDIDCTALQWCAPSEVDDAKFCKNYVGDNEECEGFTLPQYQNRCNPSTHICYKPDQCRVSDLPGLCRDLSLLLQENDCCFSNEECESGICASDGEGEYGTQVCKIRSDSPSSCEEDRDCQPGSWCASHSTESNFCKAYAMEGASCNAYTLPEDFQRCNPETHYCYEPESCVIADAGGTCQLKNSHLSKMGDCCSSNKDCDSNVCAEGETSLGTIQKLCQEEDNEGATDAQAEINIDSGSFLVEITMCFILFLLVILQKI